MVQWRPCTATAELFCDARGSPARVAAVLFIDCKVLYTDWAPHTAALDTFLQRNDDQIMGQELMAIPVGLSTFANLLAWRSVRVWTDNVGGGGCPPLWRR